MQVKVKLFGDLASLAGRPEVSIDLDEGATLAEALVAMDQESGRSVSESLLFDEQTILPSVAMLVNGNNVLLGEGLRTPLSDGDRVAVMPLMGGGSLAHQASSAAGA